MKTCQHTGNEAVGLQTLHANPVVRSSRLQRAARRLACASPLAAVIFLSPARPSALAASPPTYLFSIGPFSGLREFQPTDVALDATDNVYVTDVLRRRVLKFTSMGDYLTEWTSPVTALAVDQFGGVYCAGDGVSAKFIDDGVFQGQITGFTDIQGVTVADDLTLYTYDSVYNWPETSEIIMGKFNANGHFLQLWRIPRAINPAFPGHPYPGRVAVDSASNVYVTESGTEDPHRVIKFSATGTQIGQWGTEGSGGGQFESPGALTVDRSNQVYVVDVGNNRVQRFSNTGTYQLQWGSAGSGPGQFQSPSGIAVNRTVTRIYVADFGNKRIHVFATGAIPPVIVRQPQSQNLPLGGKVTFAVEAVGATPLGYQWHFEDMALPGAAQPTLTLSNLSLAHAGLYTVEVSNTLGTAISSPASLIFSPLAPSATTHPMGVLSPTRLLLRGMATPRATNSVAWFEWGTNMNYGSATAPTNLNAGNNVVFVSGSLSGLDPTPVYHCRLVVSNLFGVAYGSDQQFALGRNAIAWGSDPTMVRAADGLSNIVTASVGPRVAIAVKNDGTVLAWGDESSARTNAPPGLSNVVDVSAGFDFGLALKNNGTVVGWPIYNFQAAANVPGGLTGIIAIAAGVSHGLALGSDGTVAGWGQDVLGSLSIPPGLNNVVAIAAGTSWSMALRSDGIVVAWGDDGAGQVSGAAGLSNLVGIAAGDNHGLGLKDDGTVVAWGSGFGGSTNVPVGLANVASLVAYEGSMALKRDGTVVVWGDTFPAQINVPPFLSRVVSIAGNRTMALALSDALRVLPIADVTVPEGDGGLTYATFDVRLDRDHAETVSVDYTTTNGTALAGVDYEAASGTLVFAAPELVKTIHVPIIGDVLVETNKNFSVLLSNSSNVILTVTRINATILNDDEATIITNQPRSQLVRAGLDVSFSVGASGGAPLRYQWLTNGIDLAGKTNSTLLFANVQPAFDGLIVTVQVTGKSTSIVSSPALLSVTAPTIQAGAVDLTFGTGKGANAAINTLAVQPDGRVLIGGAFTTFDEVPRGRVARLTADGTLDDSFANAAANGEVLALALQPNGKVLIAGTFTNVGGLPRLGLARLHDNGAVDTNFNPALGASNLWQALLVQPDGKIVAGGTTLDFRIERVVRLNSDGILDSGFVPPSFNQFVVGERSTIKTLVLQPDGKITVGGDFFRTAVGVARLNTNGSLDTTFSSSSAGVKLYVVRTLALLPDGKVLMGGTSSWGPRRECLARLLPNGLLDQSFVPGTDVYSEAHNPNLGPAPSINAVVLQSDGRLFLGGEFGAVNGETNRYIARLLADGRRDPSFYNQGGPDAGVLAAATLNDGRALIAGRFTAVDGVPRGGIARLLGDDGPPRIGSPPANAEGTAGFPVSFSVATTNGRPPLRYQWHFNDSTALPAGTNATLTLSQSQLADAGNYRVVVSNALGAVTSTVATLTIYSGPRLLSAGSVDGGSIGLCFSVPVTTNSATNVLNYSITSGGPITNAVLRADGRTVLLGLQSLASSPFSVTASSLVDAGPGRLGGGSATGSIAGLTVTNFGSPSIFPPSAFSCAPGEIEVTAGGIDVWNNSDECGFWWASQSGDFDVKVRAGHLLQTHPNAKAGLMVRESVQGDSATLHLSLMPPPPSRNIYQPGVRRFTRDLTWSWGLPEVTFNYGDVHADPPDSWMRLKRTGNLFQGFSSVNGYDWRLFALTNQAFSNTVSLGLFLGATSSLTNGTALFRNYDPQYGGPVADALDTTGRTWTTSGSPGWFPQSVVTHDGRLALQSGAVGDGGSSSVETTVVGPGTLLFWWKVSSEAGADRLKLVLDGTAQFDVSGTAGWEQRTVTLPAGSHAVTWTYAKNSSVSEGADAGWLDQVTFEPSLAPPVIVTQPADLAVQSTSNATFTVVASSTTPVSFQWFFNQTTPVGFSSATLLVTNVGVAQLGSYHVVVSNSAGSVTSRVATLDFPYPPVIVTPPQSRTNIAGDDVTFSVTVTNNATLPIGYSWRKGSIVLTNIVLNARTCSFTLFNVGTNVTSTSGPGNYRVVITNAGTIGPAVLAQATLTVLPATPPTASTLAATSITPNGATLNASINPMGAQSVAWFDYGLTAAYGNRTSATNVGNAAGFIAFTQAVSGLLSGMNYHYRVVATNHGGMALGADLTFTTPAPPPRPTISSYARLGDGRFRLQFEGVPGTPYTVLVSANLLDWTPLGPVSETAPGQFEFTDADAPGQAQRFYRLQSP